MKRSPLRAAAKSTERANQQVWPPLDVIVSPREMKEARERASEQAVAALVGYVTAARPTPERKAMRFTEVMSGIGLTADAFRDPSEDRLVFQAAVRAAERGRLDLAELETELRGAPMVSNPVRIAERVRGNHAHLFGGRLGDKHPAENLETSLAAYSRLQLAHEIQSSSKIGTHPREAREWANEIATLERRVTDALNARRTIDDTLAVRNSRLPADFVVGFIGAAGLAAATAGAAGVAVLSVGSALAMLAGLAVGACIAIARAPLHAHAAEEKARGRQAHTDLYQKLRSGPAASPGR